MKGRSPSPAVAKLWKTRHGYIESRSKSSKRFCLGRAFNGSWRAILDASLGADPFTGEDWTLLMLHKCANPACNNPFRSLREGKLFLAETSPSDAGAFDGSRRKLRRREHFWLCDACSVHYTLRFDSARGMLTVPFNAAPGLRFLTGTAASA